MLGRPTDRLFRQSVVSDQCWRISLATRPVFDIEIFPCDMLNGLKQFLNRGPMASSEIQGMARPANQQMLDRAGMRIGKVQNVDEVAHAGSITRVIVRSHNPKIWPAAQSSLDCDGYGVSFRGMPFANFSFRVGFCSVKIKDLKPW